MKLKLFQVDAFTEKIFSGNPAAVVPLGEWLPDGTLQNIALENNLSETAFFVKKDGGYHLRWFTPAREVDLCGHATLATTYVLFDQLGYDKDEIHFSTLSGELIVRRKDKMFVMDFPAIPSQPVEAEGDLAWAGDLGPLEILTSKQDLIIVLSSESEVAAYRSSGTRMNCAGCRGVIVTARGKDVDFVSRCFYPELSVEEDPVTGSAHCQLVPYWSQKLGKTTLKARQISRRGGEIVCKVKGDRVFLTGAAVMYLEGELCLNDGGGNL